MKKLFPVLIGLTALLTACPQPPTPTPTHTLTVAVTGVTEAPVVVTNDTTKTQLYSGVIANSKTFADVKEGSVITITPQTVNTYTTPAPQTLTLAADQTVTLNYAKAALHTYYDASGYYDGVTTNDSHTFSSNVLLWLKQDANGNLTGFLDTISDATHMAVTGNVDTGELRATLNSSYVMNVDFKGAFTNNQYAATWTASVEGDPAASTSTGTITVTKR